MSIYELFSKRQRRARGEFPDVYQYETLPPELRAQLVHILRDLLGDPRADYSKADKAFKRIHDILCREYGQFRLSKKYEGVGYWQAAVFDYLLTCSTEHALDVIEVTFRLGTNLALNFEYRQWAKPSATPDEAVSELNQRFREHGVGFQFESGEIIRVDSQVLHAEAVKPALQLLAEPAFAGANDEFLKAHEHYRHDRYSDCMNECLKSFESTLKIICAKRKWSFKETDTAKTLLDVVFAHDLIPQWLQSEFTALRSTLESGVPTTPCANNR